MKDDFRNQEVGGMRSSKKTGEVIIACVLAYGEGGVLQCSGKAQTIK
jgi:hypothetical protein